MKTPKPGAVKSRLAVEIGEDRAAEIAISLARRTVSAAEQGPWRLQFWCSPGPDDDFYQPYASHDLHAQRGNDLGQRMQAAISEGLKDADRVVLVGTDCPLIDTAYLEQAMDALATHDVVLGPAEDGGYGLVGARREIRQKVPDIFTGIDWGTDQVLAQTCRKLNDQRVRYTLLPLIWDVDRPEDLPRYDAWLASQA